MPRKNKLFIGIIPLICLGIAFTVNANHTENLKSTGRIEVSDNEIIIDANDFNILAEAYESGKIATVDAIKENPANFGISIGNNYETIGTSTGWSASFTASKDYAIVFVGAGWGYKSHADQPYSVSTSVGCSNGRTVTKLYQRGYSYGFGGNGYCGGEGAGWIITDVKEGDVISSWASPNKLHFGAIGWYVYGMN